VPARVLAGGAASMVKRMAMSATRQQKLRDDFRKNVPQHIRLGLREYERWLHHNERPAERLCRAGVPTGIVHAEKGDGGLTAGERRTLEACPHAHVVTIPGAVFFLPIEIPQQIAGLILEAARSVPRMGTSRPARRRAKGATQGASVHRMRDVFQGG